MAGCGHRLRPLWTSVEPANGNSPRPSLLRDSLRRLTPTAPARRAASAQSPVTDLDRAVAAVNAALADSPHTEPLRDGRL